MIGINIGFSDLLRRLGLNLLYNQLKNKIPEEYITPDEIDIPGSDNFNLKLKFSEKNIKNLHPSDIAEIVEGLKIKI